MSEKPSPTMDPAAVDTVRAYHERTKHRLDGYAAGPGSLDWDAQPVAFRRYLGSTSVDLPLGPTDTGPTFSALASGRPAPAAPLDRAAVGRFLRLALGVSAWKRYGTARWALRCNPSSGNLHPTEGYLVLPGIEGIGGGIYHYNPQDHQLELRHGLDGTQDEALRSALPDGAFLLGLATIPWREAWKYGERAARYCLLDGGHALGALRYAAAVQGWTVDTLDHLPDDRIARLLGLDREADFEPDEPEYAELLCLVRPAGGGDVPQPPDTALLETLARGDWHGKANRLSAVHDHQWPLVDELLSAVRKPETPWKTRAPVAFPAPLPLDCETSAASLITRRRSAQHCDGRTALTFDAFLDLIDQVLPRPSFPPWGDTPERTRIHLLLFVHRVEGLAPGLYALPRDPSALDRLKDGLRDEFLWQHPEGVPDNLPLYLLVAASARNAAARLACQQPIAADGAFAVAMLGEFDQALEAGPWGYRDLMREAGLVGQALYLGAEAADLQGTGIGCFFDDALHELFGLSGTGLQVVYQFTVGKALWDGRITDEPAYAHLVDREP